MKIYIDKEYRCYTSNPGGNFREFNESYFDGKCKTFIEGYCFIPSGETWVREDGVSFYGEMIAPWKPYDELDAAQRQYEQELLVQKDEIIAELDAVLLETQYNILIGGS